MSDSTVRAAYQYSELKTLELVARMLKEAGETKAEEIVRSYWRMTKPDWWVEEVTVGWRKS